MQAIRVAIAPPLSDREKAKLYKEHEKEWRERAEWDACIPYVDVLRRYRRLDAADKYCVEQRGTFVTAALSDDGSLASDYALALTFDLLGEGDRKKHEPRFFRIMRRWSSRWGAMHLSPSMPSPMVAAATSFGLIPREGRDRMYEHFLVAVRESPFQRVLLERFSRAAFFPAVGEVAEPNNSSGARRRSTDSIPATIKSGWLFRNKDKKRFYTLSSDGLDCVKQGTHFGSSIDKKHSVRFPLSLATAKAADKSLIISVPNQPGEWLIAESKEEASAWANAITARAGISRRIEIDDFTAMGERDVLAHYKRAVAAGNILQDMELAKTFVDVQVTIARDHTQFLRRVLTGYVGATPVCLSFETVH